MLFRQILHDDLGCASYVVACGGSAAIVDPQWDISPYLKLAENEGLQITDILLTHNHADHVSGHGRLVAATSAQIHVSVDADAEYEHDGLKAGDSIRVGKAELRAIATPGHRPEHMSFLVIDHARSDEPWALLSGDFVFVGDLARPDLAVEPKDGAAAIYDSLEQLRDVDGSLEVWPGHTGGSLCGGAGMSRKPSSTLGYERAANDLLSCDSRDAFIDELTSGLSPQPPNFQRIAELNSGNLLTDASPATPLAPTRAADLLADGAVLVDVRDPREYDAEHIPGSLNVTAAASGVGTRAAWLTQPEDRIIVNASTDSAACDTISKLQSAGLLHSGEYLAGGIATWRDAGLDIESTPTIDIPTLAIRIDDDTTLVVDVREDDEWEAGHLEGSVHAPFHKLRERIPDEVRTADPGTRIAVACSAGNRSALAASHLRRMGIANVDHVTDGGIADLSKHDINLTTGD